MSNRNGGFIVPPIYYYEHLITFVKKDSLARSVMQLIYSQPKNRAFHKVKDLVNGLVINGFGGALEADLKLKLRMFQYFGCGEFIGGQDSRFAWYGKSKIHAAIALEKELYLNIERKMRRGR